MGITDLINNTTGVASFFCNLNIQTDFYFIWTVLITLAVVSFGGIFVFKKDLYVAGAGCTALLGFISLAFRLVECSEQIVSTYLVIVFFVLAGGFAALVKVTRRNDN